MASIQEYLNYLQHRRTLAQFSGANAHVSLIAAARRAFRDSDYEQSLGDALRFFLFRGGGTKVFLLTYTRWLDMLSRNEEALPILEWALDGCPDPQLATQLAWAIADVGPVERFDENAKWLAIAAADQSVAVCIADTRGWMAYRAGDFEAAFSYLIPLAPSIVDFPDIGYHLAAVSYARGQRQAAAAYLDQALAGDCPFGGIYDAMRLRARLLQETAATREKIEGLDLPIPLVKDLSTSERGLVVSLQNDEVICLTWDRIWELADATTEQKQACYVTEDRLGLMWPDQKLALTTLHIKEAAMKGNVPPEYRPLYGRYPKSWITNGIRVDTSKSDRDTAGVGS